MKKRGKVTQIIKISELVEILRKKDETQHTNNNYFNDYVYNNSVNWVVCS